MRNIFRNFASVKTQISILILAVALLLTVAAGCRRATHHELERAEAMTPSAPEASVALLESIPTATLSTADRALHALLLTQARYKCGADEASDTLISLASEHYDATSDKRRRMLAHFYHGFILHNARRSTESVNHLLTAQALARELADTFHMAMVSNTLSHLHQVNYNSDDALRYARETYELFKARGEDIYTIEALYSLAVATNNVFDHREALRLATSATRLALEAGDTALAVNSMRVEANSLMMLDSTARAFSIYRKIISYPPTSESIMDYSNMAHCAFMSQRADEADSIIDVYLASGVAPTEIPAEFWTRRRDYEAAYAAEKQYSTYLDSLLALTSCQEVSGAEVSWSQHRFREAERARRFYFIVATGCLLLLLAVVLVAVLVMRLKNAREGQLLTQLSQLASVQTAERRRLLDKYFADTNAIFTRYISAPAGKMRIGDLRCQLDSDLRHFLSSPDLEEQLMSVANHYHPSVMERFDSALPTATPDNRLMFLLYACGFDTTVICLFLRCDQQAVYTRKSRLRAQLRQLPSPLGEQLLSVFG